MTNTELKADELAPLDGGEIWEWLYTELGGNVPDEMSDELLARLAAHINETWPRNCLSKPAETQSLSGYPDRIGAGDFDSHGHGRAIAGTQHGLYVEYIRAASLVPSDGWKLVPVEPTEAMLDAYWHQTGESKEMRGRVHSYMRRYYAAMLAASPSHKSGE